MHVLQSLAPVTASLTGYLSNATGATWTLTTTTAGDGMAHLTTIKNDTATDESLKYSTITGTDCDGYVQTEVLYLPAGSATVTGLKYFLTISTIVPSASIAGTMDLGWAADAYSPTIMLNWRQQDFQVSLGLVITGTISVTVQHTFDRLSIIGNMQSANWFNHSSLATTAATADGNYAFPAVATHLKLISVTNGATVKFYVTQGQQS